MRICPRLDLRCDQVSPPGYWYDQDEAEWVIVLNGSARLAIAGERDDRLLREGGSFCQPVADIA